MSDGITDMMREFKSSKYRWDWKPVLIKHGHVLVQEDKEHPLKWYNYEVHLIKKEIDPDYETLKVIIPAIEITNQDGCVFHISNHFGIGIHSLLQGGSWMQVSFHFDEPYEFIDNDTQSIMEYDHIGYHAHELKRMAWQRLTYPVQFEKIEALRKLIKPQ